MKKILLLIGLELYLVFFAGANLVADWKNVYEVDVSFSGCAPYNGWSPDYYCQITTNDTGLNGRVYKLFRDLNTDWLAIWKLQSAKGAAGISTTRWPAYNWDLINEDTTGGLDIKLIKRSGYEYWLQATSGSNAVWPNMGYATYYMQSIWSNEMAGSYPSGTGGCSCSYDWDLPPWTAFTRGTATLIPIKTDFTSYAHLADDVSDTEYTDYTTLKVLTDFWLADPNDPNDE